jgi:endonuclease IV
MDKRKPVGRTASELAKIFHRLPEASFCLDIGHARQVDPSMTVAYFLLKEFAGRLRQLHMSEVNSHSTHDPLSYASILAFQELADMIPESVPIILETPVPENRIEHEMRRAIEALPIGALAVVAG